MRRWEREWISKNNCETKSQYSPMSESSSCCFLGCVFSLPRFGEQSATQQKNQQENSWLPSIKVKWYPLGKDNQNGKKWKRQKKQKQRNWQLRCQTYPLRLAAKAMKQNVDRGPGDEIRLALSTALGLKCSGKHTYMTMGQNPYRTPSEHPNPR